MTWEERCFLRNMLARQSYLPGVWFDNNLTSPKVLPSLLLLLLEHGFATRTSEALNYRYEVTEAGRKGLAAELAHERSDRVRLLAVAAMATGQEEAV